MATCPSCGRDVAAGFAFCPHCGALVSARDGAYPLRGRWVIRRRTVRIQARGIALAGALILLAGGCTATPSASVTPSPPPSVEVSLEESAFVPASGAVIDGVPALTIPVGTTVTWTNLDLIDHTATEYLNGFPKPDARFDLALAPEASGSYTFDEAGTYEVGCVPHPAMQMVVIVE